MSNTSDFFGNGAPQSGVYEVPPVGVINDLTDVTIVTPANNQSLVYQSGFWVNAAIDYTTLDNLPTLVNNVSDLGDVDLTGLADDYVLVWDTTSSTWKAQPKDPAHGISSHTDTLFTLPLTNNQVMKYSGGKWVNSTLAAVSYSGSFSDLASQPTSASYTFTGLQQTNDVAIANGYLKWNTGGTSVEYVTTIPASAITGLNAIATSINTYTIGNINAASPANNDVLKWNSGLSAWVPSSSIGTKISAGSNCFVDVNLTTDDVILQGGTTSGNIDLRTYGTGKIKLSTSSGDVQVAATQNLKINTTATLSLQGIAYPSTAGSVGEILSIVSANTLGFIPQPITTLDTLTDVDYPSAPTAGKYLIFNGGTSKWEPSSIQFTLNDASDVVISAPANKHVVFHNGTQWVNQQLSYSDLSGSQPIPVMTVANLSDVYDSMAPALNHVLYYDNANTRWTSKQLTYADITGTAPNPTTLTLSGLLDVDNLVPATKHVLFYNVGTSTWISKQLSYNDLSSLPALKTVATSGLYTDLTGAPFLPGGLAVNLTDISNVNAPSPTNGQYLKWDSGTSKWIPSTIPTVVTSLAGLTTDVSITAPTNDQFLRYDTGTSKWVNETVSYDLDSLTDVIITGPVANQYVKYNGTNWVNAAISYSDISGTPTLTTTLESLTNVQDSGFNVGDTIMWDGVAWVNYAIDGVEAGKILDSNSDCYVDVTTNDDITIQAGAVSPTGGNIIIKPNKTVNANASIIIETIGASVTNEVYSDDPINVSSAASVSLQGIEYPAIDGNNGDVLMTNGSGVTSFAPMPLPVAYVAGYKSGLTLSKTNSTEITVNVGICRDQSNSYTMIHNIPFVKTLSTWTAGSGNGGMPASLLPVVNNRFYYVFGLCDNVGGIDVGFDTSETAVNLLAVSGTLDFYRKLGIIWTNSSGQIEGFTQIGDDFILDVPKTVYTYTGTSPILNPLINISTNLPNALMDVVFNFTMNAPAANDIYVTVGKTSTIPSTVTANNNVYFDYATTARKCFRYTINNDVSFKMTSTNGMSSLSVNLTKFKI